MSFLNILFYFQYCEYYPEFDKCKKWLEKNIPTEFAKLNLTASAGSEGKVGEAQADGDDDKKKPQKRGGKGMIKPNKKKEDVEKRITVSRAPRGKKKSVTVVTGLSTFGKSKQLTGCWRQSLIIFFFIYFRSGPESSS